MRPYKGLIPHSIKDFATRNNAHITDEALRELYRVVGKLQQNQSPSGSSTPVVSPTSPILDDYLFKPGLPGGQIAWGGTGDNDTLILRSSKASALVPAQIRLYGSHVFIEPGLFVTGQYDFSSVHFVLTDARLELNSSSSALGQFIQNCTHQATLPFSVTGSTTPNAGLNIAEFYGGPSGGLRVSIAGRTDQPILLVASGAGQTGDLFRVQNSAAAKRLWVDSGGFTNISGIGAKFNGSTSGVLTLLAGATTTSYTLTLPSAQGAASTYLKNDGSGGLTWATVSGGSLADHTHSATGDGGDSINANSVVSATVQASTLLKVGNPSNTNATVYFYSQVNNFKQAFGVPPSTGYTADRSIILPDVDGNLFLTGNESHTTAADSGAGRIGTYNLVAQTATIAAKKIGNSAAPGIPTGMYSIYAQLACTTAGTGNITLTIAWTTDGGGASKQYVAIPLTAQNVDVAVGTLYRASGDITFSVTGTIAGGAQYALRLRAAYMGV